MKKIFIILAVGIIGFALARSHSFAFNLPAKNSEAQVLSRPYIVDIVETDGTVSKELKGISSQSGRFLISQDLAAAPFPEDRFKAFPDIKMDIGSKITLYRAPVIKIKDGKRSKEVRSWTKTVGELFTEQKIELGKDDRVNFASDTDLENGMEIAITRVAITNIDEKEPIDFAITKKEDKTLDEGKTRIEVAGVAGVRTKTYQVRREDGEEVSRKLINSAITTPPVTEILIIGTKPVITVRCNYNETVIAAALKYSVNANTICNLMMKESNGHATSVSGGGYKGLFQYEDGFWADVSRKAGYGGASVFDPTAQIFTTAWAWSHGLSGRW